MNLNLKKIAVCGLALVASLASSDRLQADERLFTYVYEADVLPKGKWEFEQWITHRTGKETGVYSAWDLREEIEFGLTDNLTTAAYLNFRQEHSDGVLGRANKSEFEFKGISSEWKYRVLNPHTKPIGMVLYVEPTYNGEEFEMEEKLILSKNFGEKWTFALNASFEQEWEFQVPKTETALVTEYTAGLSYKLSSHWAVGVEGRNKREFEDMDFSKRNRNAWFIGPNVHYGGSKWWATLTVLPQIAGGPATRDNLDLKHFERVEVRLIAGINF